MPGESALHLRLKRAGCDWLWNRGYAAIAEEVVVPGLGIIDVAGAGRRRLNNPRRVVFERQPTIDRYHVVFVECKAFRADFLRDQGRQLQFAFAMAERRARGTTKRHRRASPALGKFDSCLIRPRANLHYLLTPPRLLRIHELPRRWGWLVFENEHVQVRRQASWQEVSDVAAIEGAIARSLTACRMKGVASKLTGGRISSPPPFFAMTAS